MILTTGIEYPTGQGMDFYGFEVLGFYLKRFLLYYSDYAWNIRLLYGLILACISHYAYSICVVYKKNPTKPTCKKRV